MKHTLEFKLECVDKYKNGGAIETPEGDDHAEKENQTDPVGEGGTRDPHGDLIDSLSLIIRRAHGRARSRDRP